MIRSIILILIIAYSLGTTAQNWDDIQSSGEYYYGVGHGKTEAEASEAAMADLVSMIATNVSSEFSGLEEETNVNGKLDHKSGDWCFAQWIFFYFFCHFTIYLSFFRFFLIFYYTPF